MAGIPPYPGMREDVIKLSTAIAVATIGCLYDNEFLMPVQLYRSWKQHMKDIEDEFNVRGLPEHQARACAQTMGEFMNMTMVVLEDGADVPVKQTIDAWAREMHQVMTQLLPGDARAAHEVRTHLDRIIEAAVVEDLLSKADPEIGFGVPAGTSFN